MARCAKCAALAREVEDFDARIHDAAMVPAPEALADRVLLRHKVREPARFGGFGFGVWALAASLVIALVAVLQLYRADVGDEERVATSTVLGVKHLAVAAIAHVLDEEPQMLMENRGVDPVMVRAAFTRRGLRVPANGTTVRYFDKCPMTGGAGEHVVLQTPFGQVTVILMPDQPFASRVVVTYRDRTAVLSPVQSGSYIVVTDSLKNVKQIEKMLM